MKKSAFSFLVSIVFSASAVEPTITIEAGRPVAKVSPLLYGLMTEEINHCYDGGLYAELVQNRAFLDDPQMPVHWSAIQANGAAATITLDDKQPLNSALPISLRLDATSASATAPAGIANDGFWGIPVQPETRYRASFFAKAAPGFSGPVTVSIQSEDGSTIYAQADAAALSATWKQYEVVLQTGKVAATTKARYVLTIKQPGTVWFSLVSLFPPTWKDRPNGLRKDLMQMLVDMKPRFLRFPGGNYLEGETIETRFKWKETLGPISRRPGHPGCWSYRSSDGMGLMEFLLWCEDMGAEPVLGIYAGYSLKGAFVKPGKDLEPFVQEALEEIEYVTGAVTTKWGAQRAKDGHPAPFRLRYVEIGNEDWFDKSGSYDGRFAQFSDAIKKKHPQLKCISTVGLEQPADKRVHSRKPDSLDEHYYRPADEFLRMASGHYDKYDRKGPEIFVGEWAAHETDYPPWDQRAKSDPPTPNMKAALGDAAFMTNMERNSDIVVMHCYAPLFVNVNPGAWQWRPDMIGYDALRSYGSPSYHAFAMFSQNVGDEILKVSATDTPVHTSVTRDSRTREIIIKLVNAEPVQQSVRIELKGVSFLRATAPVLSLSAEPEATNTLDEPKKVAPVASEVRNVKPSFTYAVPAHSVVVLKLKAG